MKYIKVDWPEIQEYMERLDYRENSYFDPNKNCWFIPESWDLYNLLLNPILELSTRVPKGQTLTINYPVGKVTIEL